MTTKTEKFIEDLAVALFKANEAAQYSIQGDPDDGGSCNFDTPYLVLPRVRRTVIEAAAEKAKVRVTPHYTMPGRWMVHVETGGQANRRTRAAEAARRDLEASGYEARIYYAVD